ncbi:MAG TPA: YceH family protein [Candidatus Manganitrophaceae bacterium]|nr:YceH family protein [Candidatus Manganitrophaceae bacterium]
MDFVLTDMEVRVLGCLIEKEMATPDYYPLSLNALQNACNQTSNREPIVSYDEKAVTVALDGLKGKELARQDNLGRVPKFSESFLKKANLVQREAAILCVLMLRGPQTVGELRGRTERLHKFETLEEVQKTLQTLEEWGYVKLLPRQPGRKEPRYAHLLSGLPETREEEKSAAESQPAPQPNETITPLQEEVKRLRQELEELRQAFLDFKGQF